MGVGQGGVLLFFAGGSEGLAQQMVCPEDRVKESHGNIGDRNN